MNFGSKDIQKEDFMKIDSNISSKKYKLFEDIYKSIVNEPALT